jgi:hypothetical protein
MTLFLSFSSLAVKNDLDGRLRCELYKAMAKNAVGLRLEQDELAALQKAAASFKWSVSFTGREAVRDWLICKGWLVETLDKAKETDNV